MSRSIRGFSLLEVLVTVTVVGTLAFLATVTVSNVTSSTQEQKLNSDVETLNRSVAAFVAAGGKLSEVSSADEVLTALKQEMENASRVPGFGGAKIDDRVTFEYQSESEANRGGLRAYWDGDRQRFVLASSGKGGGIKGLGLSNTPSVAKDSKVKAAKASMLYSEEGSWIWDYAEGAPTAPPKPIDVTLGDTPDTTPVIPSTPSTPPSSSLTPLTPPTYSLATGSYPISSFNLPLTLSNPNPPGTSEIYYSVDYGNWNLYSGPLTVPPGTVVAAQAIALDDSYQNSSRLDQTYSALPAGLIPPVISPSSPLFGLFSNRLLTVTITDLNPGGISKIQYRVGGDPWQDYTAPFSLTRDGYPSGAMVEARSVPTDPYYLASTATLRTLGVEAPNVAGTSLGNFSDPSGDSNMLTNITSGGSSSYFEWGRDYLVSGENMSADEEARLKKSTMDFAGNSFTASTNGESFEVGSLTYYNGTIVSNTGAKSIKFSTNVALNVNGYKADTTFTFDFDLINTVNLLDPNDKWADADYVKLRNSVASETLDFNGVLFKLQLEFGETTPQGISLFDEFHVLEGKTATTKVYGTLVEVGTVDFNL